MKRDIPIEGAASRADARAAHAGEVDPDGGGAPRDDAARPASEAAPREPSAADAHAAGADSATDDRDPNPEDVEERLAALHDEIETLNDQHLRLAAEFQNYRKRVNREREEMRARSQAELVGVLLDALDDLERVTNVDAESASAASLIEGVDLVERKLQRALEAAGGETIDAVGKPFDPETMEAIGAVPTDDPERDDTVARTLQRGYRMHGILVRPARVQVLQYGG